MRRKYNDEIKMNMHMKTRKMIAMAGTVLLSIATLASCSKGGGTEELQPGLGADRSIRLSAGLQAVTKAVIGSGASFTTSVGGWESTSGADYAVPASWLSTASVSVSGSASDIGLTPKQYYSQNGAERTFIKAWYPQGTLTGGVVSFAGTTYKGDGTDDILLADEVSGSAIDAATKTLVFKHLTTQLRFTVQGDALFGATTTVKSVSIKGTGVPAGLDLRTNALVYDAASVVIVPGIDGSQAITEQATQVGESVMVPPFGAKTFKIDVVTVNAAGKEIAYRDVVVTVSDASTLPGKVYTIALTFAGYDVTTQASVVEWDYTGTGSVDVTDEGNKTAD